MYGGGMPQTTLPQNVMQQRPGDINAGRDRITQALMDVQNPPPVTPMLPQQGMPPATGAPPMAGAMPGAAAPQAMGAMPGQMPAGGGMPGQMPPLVGQGGAMPGLSGMTQPGMPSPLQRPQTPGGPTY
jgi:hypothetical protein